MREEIRNLILNKIEILSIGHEFGLKELFGVDWALVGNSGQKRSFGKEFKNAVQNREFHNIEHIGITNLGRYDLYRKL